MSAQTGAALALPGLRGAYAPGADESASGSQLAAARWLASRGRRIDAGDRAAPVDWRAWLLAQYGPGADLLRRHPAGVAVRTLATGRVPVGCWGCAEPVHLLTDLDRLRLAPGAKLALTEEEAGVLGASLNAVLDGSGFVLHPAVRGPWSVECRDPIECSTTDPALLGGSDIRELLPAGRDGARVRWLMNELQVALHEHPMNQRRMDRGTPPVNSLWPWGFGVHAAGEATSLPILATDDDWLRGAWRLNGAEARPLAEAAAVLADRESPVALLAASGIDEDPPDQLARWEAQACRPVAAALRRGQLGEARLLLGDTAYHVRAATRFAAWRRPREWMDLLS